MSEKFSSIQLKSKAVGYKDYEINSIFKLWNLHSTKWVLE